MASKLDRCSKQGQILEWTALLYSYRDIFASDNKDVSAANIPPQEIALMDNKIVNKRCFRYNPVQEKMLEENVMKC